MQYSHCLSEIRDFESAQRILERLTDLVFVAGKTEHLTLVRAVDPVVQSVEALIHLEIASFLMESRELGLARQHFAKANALLEKSTRRYQRYYYDGQRRTSAYLEILFGNLVAAEEELASVQDPMNPLTQVVRAKLDLKRLEHAGAETSLRLYHNHQAKLGTLHRPGLLETTLDLADALFGQGKHDDAFASFDEARAIVADFALPADDAWRKALATWLQRTKELGRTELAMSLEKELAQVSAMPMQAITILEKFRIQPGAD